MNSPTWHILGSGAMGSFLALRLRQSGLPCRLLQHQPEPRMQRVVDAGEQHELAVEPIRDTDPDSIAGLIITTKAAQLTSALELASPFLREDAIVMTPANGLGFENSEIVRALPRGLLRAVTTAAAFRDREGVVHTVTRGETRLGDPAGRAEAPAWFRNSLAGLDEWTWDPQINKAIGRKFSINCVINPLTALRRCRNGELLAENGPIEELRDLCAESEPALRALNLWTTGSLLDAASAVCRETAGNRSSMLQDVLAGRPTEIAYLNGALLRRSEGRNLPLNEALTRALEAPSPAAGQDP